MDCEKPFNCKCKAGKECLRLTPGECRPMCDPVIEVEPETETQIETDSPTE